MKKPTKLKGLKRRKALLYVTKLEGVNPFHWTYEWERGRRRGCGRCSDTRRMELEAKFFARNGAWRISLISSDRHAQVLFMTGRDPSRAYFKMLHGVSLFEEDYWRIKKMQPPAIFLELMKQTEDTDIRIDLAKEIAKYDKTLSEALVASWKLL
jgi:hypothetical protein